MSDAEAQARRRALLAARLTQGAPATRSPASGASLAPSTPSADARLGGTNAAPGEPVELSPYQRPLWLHHRLYPESRAATVLRGHRLSSVLDRARLATALAALGNHHWLLRCAVSAEGQLLPGEGSVPLHWHEVADGDLWEACADYCREGLAPPALDAGGLFRAHVFASRDACVLLLCVHHIIADGVSLDRLVRDLARLYREPRARLSDAEVDWLSLSRRQWERLSRSAALHDAYWRERLVDLPPARPLPLASSPTGEATFRGGLLQVAVPEASGRAALDAARRLGVTPYQFFLAIWIVLQARHLQTDEVVTGTPVSVRTPRETGAALGYFLNVVVLRVDLSSARGFEDVLALVRQATGQVLAHAEYPFDQVVRAVVGRAANRKLFSSLFSMVEPDPSPIEFDAAVVEERELEHGGAAFDLSFLVVKRGGRISLAIEFDEGLYARSEVGLLFDHYLSLLDRWLVDPRSAWRRVPLLGDADREALRGEWRAIAEAPGATELLQSAFERQAKARPDHIALRSAAGEVRYGELSTRAAEIAARLRQEGCQEGQVVAIAAPASPACIAAMLGVLEAGATFLPLDPSYPAARIRMILDDAGADFLLLGERESELRTWEALRGSVRSFAIDELDSARAPAPEPGPGASPDAAAWLIYTSGSSGRPKGVRVSHGAAVFSTAQRKEVYRGTPPERFLLLSSPAFDSAMAGIWWTLSSGGTLCLIPSEEIRAPEVVVERIRSWEVTHTLCLPSLWRAICRLAGDEGLALSCAIVAGEACTAHTVREHFRCARNTLFYNEYGPTEMTVWSTAQRVEADACDPVPIGVPLALTQALVLDREGDLLPRGVPGELLLAGHGLADGYHGAASLSERRFVAHPLDAHSRAYRTGDRVLCRADGSLIFLGRVDAQVKIRGYRVECGEVERVLAQAPGVDEVAVLPWRGDSLHEMLAALDPRDAEDLLSRVEGGSAAPFALEGPGFRLTLELEASTIRPPRQAQRDWILRSALREWGADLEALDRTSERFVPGTEREFREGFRRPGADGPRPQDIMEDWQIPIMRAMAEIASAARGHVLEIGFGRGIASDFIQQLGVASHTIVEAEPAVVERFFRTWRARYGDREIRLIEGRWQDAELPGGRFDAVLFHVYPLDEDEFIHHIVESTTYAEHAIPAMAELLRPGGSLTYLSNEIDSLSRAHQRVLFAHFDSIRTRVQPLEVPADTRDAWWAPTMVIIEARKAGSAGPARQ